MSPHGFFLNKRVLLLLAANLLLLAVVLGFSSSAGSPGDECFGGEVVYGRPCTTPPRTTTSAVVRGFGLAEVSPSFLATSPPQQRPNPVDAVLALLQYLLSPEADGWGVPAHPPRRSTSISAHFPRSKTMSDKVSVVEQIHPVFDSTWGVKVSINNRLFWQSRHAEEISGPTLADALFAGGCCNSGTRNWHEVRNHLLTLYSGGRLPYVEHRDAYVKGVDSKNLPVENLSWDQMVDAISAKFEKWKDALVRALVAMIQGE